MKKSIFLLMVMLMSGVCANAVNWQPVSTSFPYTDLYIDLDSIKYPQENECVYALRYRVANNPEKIAYIKSNFDNNYVGIIRVADPEDDYRPNAVLNNPRVFMKPIPEDSFLNDVHKYALANSKGYTLAEAPAVYHGEKPILRDDLLVAYQGENALNANVQSYLEKTCKILEKNWQPPATGRMTRTIIYTTIGADGSLLNYQISESSGDDTTDRSVISAVERTVPYMKLPKLGDKEVYSMDFKFVFEHDLVRKSVVY